MITLEQAKRLRAGDYLHHIELKNADGTPQRFRVTSVKTWKTRPDQVRIGLKRGLYEFYRIDQTELKEFELGYS